MTTRTTRPTRTNAGRSRRALDAFRHTAAADIAARDGITETDAEAYLAAGRRDLLGYTGAGVIPATLPTREAVLKFESQLCLKCNPKESGPFGCKVYCRAIGGDRSQWFMVLGNYYCTAFDRLEG